MPAETDEVIKRLMKISSEGTGVQQFELFAKDVDYHKLVELIFEYGKVVSWR